MGGPQGRYTTKEVLRMPKHGKKYSDIAKYMEDETSVSGETAKKIEKLHKNNQHKFNIPTYRRDL